MSDAPSRTSGGSPTPASAPAADSQTVVLSIQQPAHVHFSKHAYRELDAGGHDVRVFVQDTSVVCDLLDAEGVPCDVVHDRATAILDGAIDRDWTARSDDVLADRTDTTSVVDQTLDRGS